MTTEEILSHIREGYNHGIDPKVIAFVLRGIEVDLYHGTVAEEALQTGTLTALNPSAEVPTTSAL